MPNLSLERISAGKALGPRGARWHHAPRGPSASSFPATQFKLHAATLLWLSGTLEGVGGVALLSMT